MPTLTEFLRQGRPNGAHRPWPRATVTVDLWNETVDRLATGEWALLGLWGDFGAVHMAILEEGQAEIAVATLDCPDGAFPSVGRFHPPAIRLERAVQDLFGLRPDGAPDRRPWLDHGRWGVRHPLGPCVGDGGGGEAYPFLAADGDALHQIAVGPIHAGIIEPGHFRFAASGETVVRLEQRLGYAHKGIERLMCGADLGRGARLAGRVSGDSTVAYSVAFARAVEAALGGEAPPRARWLRALMAELERLANHFGDIGAVCNDAAFALMHAHCGILRELVLRAADRSFGHRLMRDRVVPGGIAGEPADGMAAILRDLVADLRRRFPPLVELYDNTTSIQDRTVATGVVRPSLARQFAGGGYVGRASGRRFDARCTPGYSPYDELRFDVPVREQGDVDARVWIRIEEVEQSLSLIEQILDRLPDGAICLPQPAGGGEGMALVEGFRGDVLVWLRIGGDGTIERCHLRDPSWFQWPLLEAAIEGNIVADFPICNKSFNCSYSGHDL